MNIEEKTKLAHEYLLRFSGTTVADAWQYADAMEAEAEKRIKAEAKEKREAVRKLLNNDGTFLEKEGQHFEDLNSTDSIQLEWQPDWSQAPDWANWWCLSVMHGAMWFSREPVCTKSTWVMVNDVKFCATSFDEAPSFNYPGNWQDSLRKRPQ